MKSLQRVLHTFVFPVVCVAGIGQAQGQAGPTVPSAMPSPNSTFRAAQTGPLPERIEYLFYFSHLEDLDHIAKRLESEGKDVSHFRIDELTVAGLTDNEAVIVNQVGLDCMHVLHEEDAQAKAAYEARRAQNPNLPPNAVSLGSDRNQALAGRNRAIDDHIAQLRQILGPASFAKLDKYVKSISGPRS